MSQKSVLVTGCSPGGIGHSLAREFHRKGLRVFATARKTETIQDLADEGIETLSLEVTQEASIQALKDEVTRRTDGKLDILVNNAGRDYCVPGLDVDMEEVRLTFETNVFAVMRMCQAFAPLLICAKGTIVQIGSVAALMPYVFGSVYNASKSALHGYSDTLRVELQPFDVRVVTIVTGGVKSNLCRTPRDLRPHSIYRPVAKEYQERLVHPQTIGMPNEKYARYVVRKVLARHPRRELWAGGLSGPVWLGTTFMPKRFMGFVFARMFKLGKLRGTWQQEKRN